MVQTRKRLLSDSETSSPSTSLRKSTKATRNESGKATQGTSTPPPKLGKKAPTPAASEKPFDNGSNGAVARRSLGLKNLKIEHKLKRENMPSPTVRQSKRISVSAVDQPDHLASPRRISCTITDHAADVRTPTKRSSKINSSNDADISRVQTPTRRSTRARVLNTNLHEADTQTPTKRSTTGKRISVLNTDLNEAEIQTPTKRSTRRSSILDTDHEDEAGIHTVTKRSTRTSVLNADLHKTETQTPTKRSSRRKSVLDTDYETERKLIKPKSVINTDFKEAVIRTPTRSSTRRKSTTINYNLTLTKIKSFTDTELKEVDIQAPTLSSKRKSLVSNDSKEEDIDLPTRHSARKKRVIDVQVDHLASDHTPTKRSTRSVNTGDENSPPEKLSTKSIDRSDTPVRRSQRRSLSGVALSDKELTVGEEDSVKILSIIKEDNEMSKTENSSIDAETTDTHATPLKRKDSKKLLELKSPQKAKILDRTNQDKETAIPLQKENPQNEAKMAQNSSFTHDDEDLELKLDESENEIVEIVSRPTSTEAIVQDAEGNINRSQAYTIDDHIDTTGDKLKKDLVENVHSKGSGKPEDKSQDEEDQDEDILIIDENQDSPTPESSLGEEYVSTASTKPEDKENESIIANHGNQTVSTTNDITSGSNESMEKTDVVSVDLTLDDDDERVDLIQDDERVDLIQDDECVDLTLDDEISSSTATHIPSAVKYQENNNLNSNVQNNEKEKVTAENKEVSEKEQLKNITRGLPVSGRWWKKEKQRFRSVNKDATGMKSWAKKMARKKDRENVLARSAAIESEKQKKRDELKERQKLNKIRREENARKSEIVQVIKDPRKIKKMKKKQLRQIETRDTTDILQGKK